VTFPLLKEVLSVGCTAKTVNHIIDNKFYSSNYNYARTFGDCLLSGILINLNIPKSATDTDQIPQMAPLVLACYIEEHKRKDPVAFCLDFLMSHLNQSVAKHSTDTSLDLRFFKVMGFNV